MSAARRAIPALALAVLVLVAAGTARALVQPEGGQAAYQVPLRSLNLEGYRSAATDADRADAEAAITGVYGGTWTVYSWNPQSRTPGEMYGSGADVTGRLASADDVRSAAERVVRDNPATFRADLAGLRFNVATSTPPVTNAPDGIRRPGKWAAHFQQTYHGIDVEGGQVHLTFLETGRLFALGSTYYPDISIDWKPALSADRAKALARNSVPFQPERDSVEVAARLLVLPVPVSETQVEHHLAWRIRVHVQDPVAVWVTDVDAQTGQILQRTNDVSFIDYVGTTAGQVERFSYCDGSNQEAYPYVLVAINGVGNSYADAAGNWRVPYAWFGSNFMTARLYSPYVDVQNMQGASAQVVAAIPPGFSYPVTFDNSNSRADERDVYKTVQDVHNFFETFAGGFGYSNQRVTAQVNINQTCNAYYSGNAIHFYNAGNGCANTGQMMDVVAHEYGHGVQEAILGGQGGEGLGEGNGDVLAFLISGSSVIGRGLFNCSGGIRNADNSLQYPGDVVGQEIHDAGRVIAGFHWDAMQDQVARYGDWGKYSTAWDWHWGRVLQLPTTQPAQVLATFIANDDDGNLTNGTPQFDSYCLAATNHGFTCPNVTLWLGGWGCGAHYQSPQFFGINQQNNYWTVVGVSPSPGDDKDVTVYSGDYLTWLGSSAGTQGTDFVVGDFNHNAMGVYHPYVSYGGATTPYVIDWESSADALAVPSELSSSVGGESGGCGLVRKWDVYLSAGQSYVFGLRQISGAADVRLSLFRNPAAAPYWAGRSSSVFELQEGSSRLYTAPASDWYGVVVFNNSEGLPGGAYTMLVQYPPDPLSSAVCQTVASSPRTFSFAQQNMYWTGVAVNPSGADDKDISVYRDPGAASAALASSAWGTGTDFVVGDFNHNVATTYYSRVTYGDPGANYVTEWDDGMDAITLGTDVNGIVGGGNNNCGLIRVSDVYLTAGQDYRFLLLTSGGADIRMALFRNPANATYWAGRSAAEFEVGQAEGRTYTAPTTDWYGVVVFNNSPDAPAGSYTLRVKEAPLPLASEVCRTSSVNPQLFSFTQSSYYWSTVAINPVGTDDKDVWVYDNADGLGNPIGFSVGTGGTDFVVGDFNHNALGTYYPMATYGAAPADYVMDWDNGPDIMPLATDVSGTVGGGNGSCGVVRTWDTYLEAGTTYQFTLTRNGSADIRAALFRNPGAATYWAGRSSSEFEMWPEVTTYSYTAPASDYYGLVVFNAAAGSPAGGYTIRLDTQVSGVGEVVDVKPGIAFQNPYPIGSPITLRASADGTAARVEIYNVGGRMVRTYPEVVADKSGRQLSWDGRSDDGARLGAGIYFVRARIGSEQINRTLLLVK